jgi:hypothetical protein
MINGIRLTPPDSLPHGQSVFYAVCVRCGAEIQSVEREGECGECGGLYRLVWPDGADDSVKGQQTKGQQTNK